MKTHQVEQWWGRRVVLGGVSLLVVFSGGCLTLSPLDNSARSEINENEEFSKNIFG